MRLVFAGGLIIGGYIVWREWQECAALNLPNSNISMGQEVMELIHQIFRYEITPTNLVKWV